MMSEMWTRTTRCPKPFYSAGDCMLTGYGVGFRARVAREDASGDERGENELTIIAVSGVVGSFRHLPTNIGGDADAQSWHHRGKPAPRIFIVQG